MNKVENSSNPFSKIISAYNIFNFLLIGLIFLIDRISKIKIINYQSNTNSIYINDYLNFELVWNTGIGFGLFNLEAGLTYHIITFFIFIIITIILFVIIKSNKVDKFLFSTAFFTYGKLNKLIIEFFILSSSSSSNCFDLDTSFAILLKAGKSMLNHLLINS